MIVTFLICKISKDISVCNIYYFRKPGGGPTLTAHMELIEMIM